MHGTDCSRIPAAGAPSQWDPSTPCASSSAHSSAGGRSHPQPRHQPGGPRDILTPWRPAAPGTGGAASPGRSSPRRQLRSPVAAGPLLWARRNRQGPSGAARALGSAPRGPGSHDHRPRRAPAGSSSGPRAGGSGGFGDGRVPSCRRTGRRSPSSRGTGGSCGASRRDVRGRGGLRVPQRRSGMGQAVRTELHADAPPSTAASSVAGTDAFSREGRASRGTGAGIGLPARGRYRRAAAARRPQAPGRRVPPICPPAHPRLRRCGAPLLLPAAAGPLLAVTPSSAASGRASSWGAADRSLTAGGGRGCRRRARAVLRRGRGLSPAGETEGGSDGRLRRCPAAPAPPSRCLCLLASPASASHLRHRPLVPSRRAGAAAARSPHLRPAPPSRETGRGGKGGEERRGAAPCPTAPRRTRPPCSCPRHHLPALPPSSARGALNRTRHRAPLRTDVTPRSRRWRHRGAEDDVRVVHAAGSSSIIGNGGGGRAERGGLGVLAAPGPPPPAPGPCGAVSMATPRPAARRGEPVSRSHGRRRCGALSGTWLLQLPSPPPCQNTGPRPHALQTL